MTTDLQELRTKALERQSELNSKKETLLALQKKLATLKGQNDYSAIAKVKEVLASIKGF